MFHPSLEELLERKCSSSVIEVLITFGIYMPFSDAATIGTFDANNTFAYTRSLFNVLDTMEGLQFEIRVYNSDYFLAKTLVIYRPTISEIHTHGMKYRRTIPGKTDNISEVHVFSIRKKHLIKVKIKY